MELFSTLASDPQANCLADKLPLQVFRITSSRWLGGLYFFFMEAICFLAIVVLTILVLSEWKDKQV